MWRQENFKTKQTILAWDFPNEKRSSLVVGGPGLARFGFRKLPHVTHLLTQMISPSPTHPLQSIQAPVSRDWHESCQPLPPKCCQKIGWNKVCFAQLLSWSLCDGIKAFCCRACTYEFIFVVIAYFVCMFDLFIDLLVHAYAQTYVYGWVLGFSMHIHKR